MILSSLNVLNYHRVGKPKRELAACEVDVSVGRQQFAEILDVVSARSDVRLSFGDDNAFAVTEALPDIARRGLPAELLFAQGDSKSRSSSMGLV